MEEIKDEVLVIAEDLRKRMVELEGRISQLQADLDAANILIGRLRTAKNAYKGIAAQGINEVRYMHRYAPHNYSERRAQEFPAEFNAIIDVA